MTLSVIVPATDRPASLPRCLGAIDAARDGLHRYNNSDHSMLTAMLAVENLVDGTRHDLWSVNADSWYLESEQPEEQPYRSAPRLPALEQA
jgi:hypothetical protein